MTIDDRFGATQSQPSQQPGARSPEYDDGLTVQDTTHGAEPEAAGIPGAATFSGQARQGTEVQNDGLRTDESHTLISADRVVGTAVYDAAGERLGTVDSVMIDKRSGRVAYAVMSFGGFLGIGERYHPLPWDALTYDQSKGGYNVQHSADDLRTAPNYSRDEVDDFDSGSTRSRDVDNYYGVDVGRHAAGATTGTNHGASVSGTATGVEAADAIGSTTGAGSSGMGSTGMGANRNF